MCKNTYLTNFLWGSDLHLKTLNRQFHIKIFRAWHPYLSEFFNFCNTCRYHWNMKTLKISAPHSYWFLRYRYLKILAKYLIGTKICHFEFTLSLITSGLKDLSSWNFVQVSFLAWEVQKSHLEYTKTNQCSVISYFKFLLSLTRSGTGKVCGTTLIQKKFFSSETKDISLTFCQNQGWVLF